MYYRWRFLADCRNFCFRRTTMRDKLKVLYFTILGSGLIGVGIYLQMGVDILDIARYLSFKDATFKAIDREDVISSDYNQRKVPVKMDKRNLSRHYSTRKNQTSMEKEAIDHVYGNMDHLSQEHGMADASGTKRRSDEKSITAQDGHDTSSLYRMVDKAKNSSTFVPGQSEKTRKIVLFPGISEYANRNKTRINPVIVNSVSCLKIFEGDEEETRKADLISKVIKDKKRITVDSYKEMTGNCTKFRENRGYISKAVTKEEEQFPIAFSILAYKDVWQVERLLRAIYRPQNYYCLHIDANRKSDVMRETIQKIVSCFDNVLLPRKSIAVVWGKFSVLEADLICMEELWTRFKSWKYFINLTGQEFPLRTNFELVQILTVFDGANDVRASLKNAFKHRWAGLPAPPHGIVPMTGSVHVTLHRKFVDFLLHDQRARDFLNWTKLTKIPDETFFSSVNYNPQLGAPGSYKGEPEMSPNTNPYLSRFKNSGRDILDFPCKGFRVRSMCILAAGDLPLLSKRRELFANKFYTTENGLALDCMEEWYFNRTINEYEGKFDFETSYYRNLDFVKNKVT